MTEMTPQIATSCQSWYHAIRRWLPLARRAIGWRIDADLIRTVRLIAAAQASPDNEVVERLLQLGITALRESDPAVDRLLDAAK